MWKTFVSGLVLVTAVNAYAADNTALLAKMKQNLGLSDEQIKELTRIMGHTTVMGQGNPAVTKHPATREECLEKAKKNNVVYENPAFEKICGAKYMAPLYDPAKEKPEQAKACIDQFEFPNMPCEYPVVWVQAKEAEELCQAEGKRLCDAHEWEGGCAGALEEPDYPFAAVKGLSGPDAFRKMRAIHNAKYDKKKVWAYGPQYKTGICASHSTKNEGCNGGDWARCGSNTYPTGMFPECVSKLGVYDQHGNAAEHMNLPTNEGEMTSRGSKTLGYTEMKGSWFIFDKYKAHEDACRWRAPYWHGSKVMDGHSHHNYHLSFRCCKTL